MSELRFTKPTMLVLEALVGATADSPAWGLSICENADLGTGTVYPILERLRTAGWVRCWKEEGVHPGRPPRLYYEITGAGRAAYREAVAARKSRRRPSVAGARKRLAMVVVVMLRFGGAA